MILEVIVHGLLAPLLCGYAGGAEDPGSDGTVELSYPIPGSWEVEKSLSYHEHPQCPQVLCLNIPFIVD